MSTWRNGDSLREDARKAGEIAVAMVMRMREAVIVNPDGSVTIDDGIEGAVAEDLHAMSKHELELLANGLCGIAVASMHSAESIGSDPTLGRFAPDELLRNMGQRLMATPTSRADT